MQSASIQNAENKTHPSAKTISDRNEVGSYTSHELIAQAPAQIKFQYICTGCQAKLSEADESAGHTMTRRLAVSCKVSSRNSLYLRSWFVHPKSSQGSQSKSDADGLLNMQVTGLADRCASWEQCCPKFPSAERANLGSSKQLF